MGVMTRLKAALAGDRAVPECPDDALHSAVCAILLEIACADGEFTAAEEERIMHLLQQRFNLAADDLGRIRESGQQRRAESLDLWQFASIIKQQLDRPRKEMVVEMCWEVVYADGTLDGHEDYLVHQLARLLDLDHRSLIEAKTQVLRRLRSA